MADYTKWAIEAISFLRLQNFFNLESPKQEAILWLDC